MAGSINTITAMRLPNGKEIAFVDWSDRPLFSTADILSGATDERIPLFNYLVGDNVTGTQNFTVKRTASERDTNISTPGAMASTEEFLVYAIKPEVLALATDADTANGTDAETAEPRFFLDPVPAVYQLMNFMRFIYIDLRVSLKTMQQAPFGYFNVGFGPSFAGPRNGIGGSPTQEAVRALGIPIHIGGQEKFEVALVNATGAALDIGISDNDPLAPTPVQTNRVFQVRILLDGLYKRPVA